MKIRLLLAPLLIVMSVVMAIWFIYPAYTNGGDSLKPLGIKEKREKLKEEKEKLSKIEGKTRRMSAMSSQLRSSAEDQEALRNYLPVSMGEESLFDNINFNASSLGIYVAGITVLSPRGVPSPAVVAQEPAVPGDLSSSVVTGMPAEIPMPKEVTFETKIVLLGDYPKIKDFLGKMYLYRRANELTSLEVKKMEKSEASSAEGVLQVDAVFKMAHLQELDKITNVETPVFEKDSLDKSVVSEIRSKKNVEVFYPDPVPGGKENLFAP